MGKDILRLEVPGVGTLDIHVHPKSAMMRLSQQKPDVFRLGLAASITRFFTFAEMSAIYALDPHFGSEPMVVLENVDQALIGTMSDILTRIGQELKAY